MLCAISGEAPQEPVASRKSGTVYEKRLIESYISENGRDPVNGEELTRDDLIDLKTARSVKPRPPALTSIPSLLSTFQNEWDALALESFTLKQHLAQLRQELSTALYNNDAAVRVIARLTKERDEARDALSKVSIQDRRMNGANGAHADGDAMQVDSRGLPSDAAEKIDATKDRLSKTRRKRPVPTGWVGPDAVQAFEPRAADNVLSSKGRAMALDAAGTTALIGGTDGSYAAYSLTEKRVLLSMAGQGTAIHDLVRYGIEGSIIATASGEVAVVKLGGVPQQAQKTMSITSHSGPATALALHPSGDILASVGQQDKTIVFYDLSLQKEIARIITDSSLTCCQFHPDGHLLAVGTATGQVKLFDVKASTLAATFDLSGRIQSISFSENGFWLAVAMTGSSSVSIWDLRKTSEIKSLDFGGRISCVRFDYTGQFLAGAGPDGVAVQYYDKSSKAWSELLRKALSATAVEWGPNAESLVVLTADGEVSLLQ